MHAKVRINPTSKPCHLLQKEHQKIDIRISHLLPQLRPPDNTFCDITRRTHPIFHCTIFISHHNTQDESYQGKSRCDNFRNQLFATSLKGYSLVYQQKEYFKN